LDNILPKKRRLSFFLFLSVKTACSFDIFINSNFEILESNDANMVKILFNCFLNISELMNGIFDFRSDLAVVVKDFLIHILIQKSELIIFISQSLMTNKDKIMKGLHESDPNTLHYDNKLYLRAPTISE
jgi:hypothetical protein